MVESTAVPVVGYYYIQLQYLVGITDSIDISSDIRSDANYQNYPTAVFGFYCVLQGLFWCIMCSCHRRIGGILRNRRQAVAIRSGIIRQRSGNGGVRYACLSCCDHGLLIVYEYMMAICELYESNHYKSVKLIRVVCTRINYQHSRSFF